MSFTAFLVDKSSGHQRCWSPASHVSRPFYMSFSMEMSLLPSSNCPSKKMVIQHCLLYLLLYLQMIHILNPDINRQRISVKKPATPITTEQNSATPATGVTVQEMAVKRRQNTQCQSTTGFALRRLDSIVSNSN